MLPIPRVNTIGWAMFETLASADITQMDLNIELLDSYIDTIVNRPEWWADEHDVVCDGVADDSEPFQDVLDAMDAAGGGDLHFIGIIRITEKIVWPSGKVRLIGYPGASKIQMDHATEGVLGFATGSYPGEAHIVDVDFEAQQANTGVIFTFTSVAARVRLTRCRLNRSNTLLQGKLYTQDSAAKVVFDDCYLNVIGDVRGLEATAGSLRIVRGSLVMPATYANALVYAGGTAEVELLDVADIDLDAHTSGTAYVLQVPNTTARASMRGCRGKANVGSSTTGFWSEEGATIVSVDNHWEGMSSSFNPYSGNQCAVGSIVDLLPALAVDAGGAAVVDSAIFGTRHYSALLIKNDVTSDIELNPGFVPGQVMHFAFHNEAVSGITVGFSAGAGVTAPVIPGSGTLGAGNTLTGTFVWESRDVSTSYRWVLQGDWGVCATLV